MIIIDIRYKNWRITKTVGGMYEIHRPPVPNSNPDFTFVDSATSLNRAKCKISHRIMGY